MFLKDQFHSSRLYRGRILCVGVIALYQILAVSLWKGGDGLPYVMDGNENWSNAGHAKNMVDYGWEGLKKSWGLADEVAEMSGKHPEAHPVIYSHGGEFPRIWITLLYLLGVVSVSQQILITAVIIGGLAVFFAYRVFEYVLESHVWAAVACGFMLTDYIGIMQWMVNTWRVWQIFSFYGSIYYVILLLRNPSNWRVQVLGAFMAFSLFYAEPVFAIFTGLSVAIFFLISKKVFLWCNLNQLLQLKGFALGALIAVALLMTQLIGYYGHANLLKDITTTIISRNFANDVQPEKTNAQKSVLYAKNNVMFMPNYEVAKKDRKIDYALKNLIGSGLSEVPFLCLMGCIFISVLCIVSQLLLGRGCLHSACEALNIESVSKAKTYAAFIILWCIYISVFYRYGNFINWSSGDQLIRDHGRGLPGLLLGSFFLGILSGSFSKGENKKMLFIALVVAILSSIVVQAFKPIEAENYRAIFKESHVVRLAYFWGCILLPFLALNQRHCERREIVKASLILGVGLFVGFLLNFIFAGYLKTGYFAKSCPLVIFGLFPLLATTVRYSSSTFLSLLPRWPASNWFGLLIAGFMVIEWVGSAATLVSLLPPHGAEAIRWIGQNCAGEVIITQNYAMPYAYETKGLARYSKPNNILSENESPRPVQFDLEKTWIRNADLIPGLDKPSIVVEYKQNHTLYGWANNFDALVKEEKRGDDMVIDSKQKDFSGTIFRKTKPNNHVEVFRINWDPIPYIALYEDRREGFFCAQYPVLSGGLARPLRSLELKNLSSNKEKLDFSAEVRDEATGLTIKRQNQSAIRLNPTPVLIINNGNTMLYGKVAYKDKLSEEGDSRIFLYLVINSNTQVKNKKSKQDYYELELLDEESHESGIRLPLTNPEDNYVLGYQPVAKDGRKGLIYLSRQFRLAGASIQSIAE